MKKVALFFLVVFLFLNVVSASFNCSIGDIITEGKVIHTGEIKSINKINVALTISDWDSVADILVDSKQITLTNTSSSQEIELLSGNYDIELINISNNKAWIEVEGNKDEIELNELEKVDGLEVYPLNIEGVYPGEDANLKLLVGYKQFFIYPNNPTGNITISKINYLIEVSSSSNNDAFIKVNKCENGTIIKVADPIENIVDDIDNSSSQNNITQNQSENKSSNGNFSIEKITNINNEGKPNPNSFNLISLIKYNFYIIPISILIILVFVFYILYKKNKQYKKEPKEKLELEED